MSSSPWKAANPSCSVNTSSRFSTISGHRKSFQRHMTEKMASTASAGAVSGRTIRQNTRHSLAPSMRAASISSSGIVSMYWRSRNTPVGVAAGGRITPHSELVRPSAVTTRNAGTRITEIGIISVDKMKTKIALRPRNCTSTARRRTSS